MPKCVKSLNFLSVPGLPRDVRIIREYEKPLQGAKMTVMDILECRDINEPAPKGKIWTN